VKVHLLTNSYSRHSGGAERLVRQLHLALLRQGIASRLVGLEHHEDHREVDASCLHLPSAYHPTAFTSLLAYVRKHVEPGDIIHAHLFPTLFYVSVIGQLGLTRAQIIATEHSTSNRRRGSSLGKLIDSITYRGYQRICSISQGTQDALLQWRPSLAARAVVIHNGIELHWSQAIERANNSRPVILSIGNLREQKNYPNMLRAVASLADLDFEYWIAGEGKLRVQAERLARELNIAHRTRFLGHISPVAPLLEKADVFLMASSTEGFGLAAAEAMNASLAVIIGDVPGLSELDNGTPRSAIKVNPDCHEDIAKALRTLLEDRKLRLRLGANAFLRSRSLGLDAMVESYIHEYHACRRVE